MKASAASLFLLLLTACGAESVGSGTDDVVIDATTSDLFALAAQLPEQCASDEIFRVSRTVATPSRGNATFSYGYRFKAAADASLPVLVFLPGGPGSASTDKPPSFVPEGWGYLMTDPRGVGCNTLAQIPADATASGAFFQTSEIAKDVVAAIREKQLSNFLLFGISYGTLLGTTVIDELEEQKLSPPRAVVLEGVLGRAFTDSFVGGEYIKQWDRVRTVLPADVLNELDTADAPYGISQDGWSRVLMNFMPRGTLETANTVAALSTSQSEETRTQVVTMFKALAEAIPHTLPGEIELYRQVACREIADTVPHNDLDVVFSQGKLVRNIREDGTKCNGLRLTTPFDSAKHQFNTKVYYFLGTDDVATPFWQGVYHYDHHNGPAVKIATKGGGHNPLQYNQEPCAKDLMASIALRGGADLRQVLDACPLPSTVDTK